MAKDKDGVEIPVDDTTIQPAPTDESTEQGVEEKPLTAPTEETIDYKAMLEAEQAANKAREDQLELERDNYKQGLLNAKEKLKEVPPANPEESFVTLDEATSVILDKARQEFKSELSTFQKEVVGDAVEDMLDSMTDNTDERALIKFHYENSIRQSGMNRAAIAADLRRAKTLANERKTEKENVELKEALRSKQTVKTATQGTNQVPTEPEVEVPLSEDEKRILTRIAERQGKTLEQYVKDNKIRLT